MGGVLPIIVKRNVEFGKTKMRSHIHQSQAKTSKSIGGYNPVIS